jgi:hypothetical protein
VGILISGKLILRVAYHLCMAIFVLIFPEIHYLVEFGAVLIQLEGLDAIRFDW